MWGKMPCVVDTLKCFLHARAEICLIWEQRSQKWLKPLCSPSVCNPRAALPRGRTARLRRGLPRGSWGAEPREPSLPSSGLRGSWWFAPPGSQMWKHLQLFLAVRCVPWLKLWVSVLLLIPPRRACPGFTAGLWSPLQIRRSYARCLPDPALGSSSCFRLTLRLSSFGFLGPKCDDAFLF